MGRVVVIHPDLGVGGAERLIVDASKALQDCGHNVRIYTGYHDKTRCFEETRDGTLETITLGHWIPRTIFGKFHALLAYIKMIYIAFYLMRYSRHDLILCDQVSACIPFLKFLDFRNKCKIVFYCHFPDQLLTMRETLIKKIYRKPIDWFEEWSTSLADIILVNSEFTSSIVRQTFKSLQYRQLTVLYPCVDLKQFSAPISTRSKSDHQTESNSNHKPYIFLSLNRFERKKDLGLAIEALASCKLALDKQENPRPIDLMIVGGYDERLEDCVLYYEELVQQAKKFGLDEFITFIRSPRDDEKLKLLASCDAVIYTPKNEHFGIVPLEAMAMSKPVIASASGGPLETIADGHNGFLCSHDGNSFAEAMLKLHSDPELSALMGKNGLARVRKHFSYEVFCDRLNEICFDSTPKRSTR